jgi:transposase
MIDLPACVYIATEPVNLHLSFDRLAGIVREQLGGDPRGEAIFVFHNRRRTHVKILWHDGRGYWILYKRLDRGTYRIPLAIPPDASSVEITRRELGILLRGVDQRVLRAARRRMRGREVRRASKR